MTKTYILASASTPWRLSNNNGIGPETTLCKAFPYLAEVLATSELLVGLDDGIAGLEERGAAGLELHAVDDKPNEM